MRGWFLSLRIGQFSNTWWCPSTPSFSYVLAFDDIADLASTCRFSDCRHEGEPGCAVRAAVDDGRLSNDRLASHRKLERELAHAERKGDARARAAETKKWKSIHKAVARQMHAKYGDMG